MNQPQGVVSLGIFSLSIRGHVSYRFWGNSVGVDEDFKLSFLGIFRALAQVW